MYYFLARITAMLVYSLISFYVGSRWWQYFFSKMHTLSSRFFWTVHTLLTAAYPASILLRPHLPITPYVFVTWVGRYFTAALFYLVILTAVLDLLRLFFPALHRRPFSGYLAAALGLLLIILLAYGTWNASQVQSVQYELDIPTDAAEGSYELVMVSDIHWDRVFNQGRLAKLVGYLKERDPDVMILAGDILDTDVNIFSKEAVSQELAGLNAEHGVYAVLGNHEYYGGEVEQNILALEQGGITVLTDTTVRIADSFYLVGRNDRYYRYFFPGERKGLSRLIAGLEPGYPVIVVDHQPVALQTAEELGVDVLLSGHTHAGQFLPFQLVTRFLYDANYGYHRRDNLQVIVSSGFGVVGPPIRVGSRPEIVEITVNFT